VWTFRRLKIKVLSGGEEKISTAPKKKIGKQAASKKIKKEKKRDRFGVSLCGKG